MAATVQIRRHTGPVGTPVPTNITSIKTRANAYDTHSTADTSNPILIPSTGTNYSYWVYTRLYAATSPAAAINNIKWYTDGGDTLGSGITCLGNDATSYVQATGTPGETGDVLNTTNYATLTATPADVFSWTSTALKSIAGSITNPSTGEFGNAFVYQINVSNAASPGASGVETFTWQYDET